MKRWLQAASVQGGGMSAQPAPIDEELVSARVAAIKGEIDARWDEFENVEQMLKHVEEWLAYGAAPDEIKGCLLREELHPLIVGVYREKFPQDFATEPALASAVEIEPNGSAEHREPV
jgi:hypothetical protein